MIGTAGPTTPARREAEPVFESEPATCEKQTDVETPALIPDSEKEIQQLRAALAPLALSTTPQHLLTLGLAHSRDNLARSIELIAQALVYDPDNPLILISLGEACFRMPEAAACTARDAEEGVLRVGSSNGAIWARVAAWRHRTGDRDGALDALRRAATAPAYDGYWIDQFLLIERALAASTNYTYVQRVSAAIGFPSALVGHDIDSVRICEGEIGAAEWRQVCISHGARLEADADTAIGVAAGIQLQGLVHRANGNLVGLARTQRRLRELHELLRSSIIPGETVLYGDEMVLTEYVAELTGHGELAAMRYLREELARREPSIDTESCRN